MGEHRPDERRARPWRRVGQVPAKRCDARELAEPAGHDGVREQPDTEGREDVVERG